MRIRATSPVRRARPEASRGTDGGVDIELHQLDLRYAGLRRRDGRRERALLSSMSEAGQQTPVIVVKGEADRYVLVDGYKRVRACC